MGVHRQSESNREVRQQAKESGDTHRPRSLPERFDSEREGIVTIEHEDTGRIFTTQLKLVRTEKLPRSMQFRDPINGIGLLSASEIPWRWKIRGSAVTLFAHHAGDIPNLQTERLLAKRLPRSLVKVIGIERPEPILKKDLLDLIKKPPLDELYRRACSGIGKSVFPCSLMWYCADEFLVLHEYSIGISKRGMGVLKGGLDFPELVHGKPVPDARSISRWSPTRYSNWTKLLDGLYQRGVTLSQIQESLMSHLVVVPPRSEDPVAVS